MEGDAGRLPQGRALLRVAGPRILRDALGPLLVFYALYKSVGTAAGIAGASLAGLGAAALARREGRPGLIAGTAVVFIVVRAVAGLVGDSAQAYLAGDVVMDALLATAFLGSLAAGRPLAAAFAADIHPVPDDARGTDGEREVFTRLTLVWAAFFVVRGAVRGWVLLSGTVDAYVAVAVAFDVVLLGLLAWSAAYALRAYRLAFGASELRGVGLEAE